MKSAGAIVANDLRIAASDPGPLIFFVGIPLVAMAFVEPVYSRLVGAGPRGGASQAVSGMAVMFGLLLSGWVGQGYFREHIWGTWDRVLISGLRPADVLLGKVLAPLVILSVQLASLFVVGGLLFRLDLGRAGVALVLVAACLACTLVALGMAMAGLCRTLAQLNAANGVVSLAFAGAGGALTPVSDVPSWAAAVAPWTPAYWAMRGFRAALGGGGFSGVAGPCAVLTAFCAVFLGTALASLRAWKAKTP